MQVNGEGVCDGESADDDACTAPFRKPLLWTRSRHGGRIEHFSRQLEEYPGQFIAHGPGTPQVLQRPSEGASDAPALDPFIVWAAKVEWTFRTVALPHSVQLGSSTRRLNTSHSNRVSQSEQWYSKIGIAP